MINHTPINVSKPIDSEVYSKLAKDREEFWDALFKKYSQEFSDSCELDIRTNKLVSKQETQLPSRKQTSLIQHWVNTGYLFCQMQDENSCSESSLCVSEKLLSGHLCCSDIEKDCGASVIKQHSDGNSSYSSVDTAAYILSNMNTTKKAEIVAIKEGAKCSGLKDCQKNGSTNEQVHFPTKQLFNATDGNIALDNNFPINIDKNMIEKEIGVRSQAAVFNKLMMQENDRDDAEIDCYISSINQSIRAKSINSGIECGSLNTKSTVIDDSCVSAGNFTSSPGRNTFYQKKLFTARESPIDLALPQSRTSSCSSISNRSWHPALDFIRNKGHSLKKHVIKKKRFSVFHETMINRWNTKQYIVSKHKRINSAKTSKNRLSVKSNKLLNNTSIVNKSISQFTNNNNHMVPTQKDCEKDTELQISNNKPMVYIEKPGIRKMEKTKTAGINVNPVVVLKRLSDDDIRKYTKLVNVTTVCKSNDNSVRQCTALQNNTANDITNRPYQYKFKRKRFSRRIGLKTAEPEYLSLIQNIRFIQSSDTDTENSLLIYKCDNDSIETSSTCSRNSKLNNNKSNTYNRNNMFLRKNKNINGTERRSNHPNTSQLKMIKNSNNNKHQLNIQFDGKILRRCIVVLERLSEQQLHKYNIHKSVECTDYNKRAKSNTNYRLLRNNRQNLNTEKNAVSRIKQKQSNINCPESCTPSLLTCKSSSTVDRKFEDKSQSVVRNSRTIDVQTQNVSLFAFSSSDEDEFMDLIRKSQYNERKKLKTSYTGEKGNGTVLRKKIRQTNEESINVTNNENEDNSKTQFLRRSRRKRTCSKSSNDKTFSSVFQNNESPLHVVEGSIFNKQTSQIFKNGSKNVNNSSTRNIPFSLETRMGNNLVRENGGYNLRKGSNGESCTDTKINKNLEKVKHLYFHTEMFDSDSDCTSLSLNHSLFSYKE